MDVDFDNLKGYVNGQGPTGTSTGSLFTAGDETAFKSEFVVSSGDAPLTFYYVIKRSELYGGPVTTTTSSNITIGANSSTTIFTNQTTPNTQVGYNISVTVHMVGGFGQMGKGWFFYQAADLPPGL